MYRSMIRTALLLGAFAALAAFVLAQTQFSIPKQLRLRGIAEAKPDTPANRLRPMTSNFYPIGWSKDGKFAYIIEPPDEACGCYFVEVYIQDVKTDKIVWQEKYNSQELPNPESENLKTYWARRGEAISEKLNEFGIVASKSFALRYPSVRVGRDVVRPRLDVRIKTDNVFMVDGTVTLRMTSNRRGSKVIYSTRYDPKETNGFRSAEVTGMLVSPFESRAVVIVAEELRGYEGPPNTIRLRLVGSSLNSGFTR